MMNRVLVAVVVVLISREAVCEGQRLSYKSFVDMVLEGRVKSVQVYDYGHRDVDAIVTDLADMEYYVESPIGLNEDHLLHHFLKERKIPLTVFDEEYKGDVPGKRYDFGIPMAVILFVQVTLPLLAVITILILALVIKRQSATISKLTAQSAIAQPRHQADRPSPGG